MLFLRHFTKEKKQVSVVNVLLSAISAGLGVTCLAAGCQGWLGGPAKAWVRLLLVACAIALIVPGYLTDVIGLAVACLVFVLNRKQKGQTKTSTEGI